MHFCVCVELRTNSDYFLYYINLFVFITDAVFTARYELGL